MSFLTFTDMGNLSGLMARVERATQEIDPLVAQALAQTGEQMVTALHDAAPVGTGRTDGHLNESFYAHEEGLSLLIFTSQAEKYHFVTAGTPTPIRPVTKRFLYSPELPHPMAWVRGQEANPFSQPIFDEAEQYVRDNIEPLAQQIALIIEGG
jgi:hypothetical protein